jgi:hypothetical protein
MFSSCFVWMMLTSCVFVRFANSCKWVQWVALLILCRKRLSLFNKLFLIICQALRWPLRQDDTSLLLCRPRSPPLGRRPLSQQRLRRAHWRGRGRPPPATSGLCDTWRPMLSGMENLTPTSSLSFQQCCGSVTFWYGSGCGSSDPNRSEWESGRPKNMRSLRIRMLIRNIGTVTSVFKDKKSKRSKKTVEIKVFLTIFAWRWKDPYLWLRDPDADPDPQHRLRW